MKRLSWFAILATIAAGCGGGDSTTPPTDSGAETDLGASDGGDTDGGTPGDTGMPPTDTGMPPTDTGMPPADTGTPDDTGMPPTDTGMPPTDTGMPPTDTGMPPTDTGMPPTDAGTPTDTGSGVHDRVDAPLLHGLDGHPGRGPLPRRYAGVPPDGRV